MNVVKEEVKEHCSIYLKQVEAFLENYSCSSNSIFFVIIQCIINFI